MKPIVLTRDQVRRVDQIALEKFGIPGVVLMENAGRGCVDVLCSLAEAGTRRVLVLCGTGNNAGDGFVIARQLAVRGIPAQCALAADPDLLQGDAAINFGILHRLGLPWYRADDPSQTSNTERAFTTADWIVDALLGTGAIGPPRPTAARLIDHANAASGQRLAVDLPSGLDCDTGQAAEPTFRAAHTCTFVGAKPGLLTPAAVTYVGKLHVLDIGVPMDAVRELL